MPTTKRRRRTLRTEPLTPAEEWDLLLSRQWWKGSAFATPWARKAAWQAWREVLMAEAVGQGHRPGAWWEYEAPGERLMLEDGQEETELAALVRLGEATPAEAAMFRREFETRFGGGSREDLFRWQPHLRMQFEHERKLLQRLDREERRRLKRGEE